jgi:hypothetical protein
MGAKPMTSWLTSHAEALGSFVAGLLAGGGAGWFFTIKSIKKSTKVMVGRRTIDMSGARAGGDNVAGDKTTLGRFD